MIPNKSLKELRRIGAAVEAILYPSFGVPVPLMPVGMSQENGPFIAFLTDAERKVLDIK